MTRRVPLSALVAFCLMVGSVWAAWALHPTLRLSSTMQPIVLRELFPPSFGDWKEIADLPQILPDPTVQAVLDATYSQTLSRSFVNSKGDVVMLSVAYGNDQNSEATAAHRPEFCYTGAGFTISRLANKTLVLPGTTLTMSQLIGTRGNRTEPISYWVTLNDQATLPGLGRKIAQIRFGLKGQIADGMLVRMSSLDPDVQASFTLQAAFLHDLYRQVPDAFKARVFGH